MDDWQAAQGKEKWDQPDTLQCCHIRCDLIDEKHLTRHHSWAVVRSYLRTVCTARLRAAKRS